MGLICLLYLFLIGSQYQKLVAARQNNNFVGVKGVHFVLNGTPYFANGFNAYWLMIIASEPSQRGKISDVFREASLRGLNLARTWAFADGGSSALQYSPGYYNEEMFKGLDFVISEAGNHGIKLILSLVNNYASFGGKKQYVEWARSKGENHLSEDDFFSNELVKRYYKKHVKTILTRKNSFTGLLYNEDPTIFAWELMNEPRVSSNSFAVNLQNWIMEMSAYVKSIDDKHLLEVGLEGFYGDSSLEKRQTNLPFSVGTDFIRNNQVKGVDFSTVHSYPDQWLKNENDQSQLSFLRTWLDVHLEDSVNVLHKPLLFTEFGKSDQDNGYTVMQREAMFHIIYDKTYASAKCGGSAGGVLFWQLLADDMDEFRDGYEVSLNQSPSIAYLVNQQSLRLENLRRMYAREKDVEKAKRARVIRRGQWHARKLNVTHP